MRHERGSVGCIFEELDRAQDDAVHAVVLLGQKQQAERKKAQKRPKFQTPGIRLGPWPSIPRCSAPNHWADPACGPSGYKSAVMKNTLPMRKAVPALMEN